jgi:transcriptional antiterminator RfaH
VNGNSFSSAIPILGSITNQKYPRNPLAYRLGIWRNSKSAIASAAKISLQRCPIGPWGVAGSMAWAVVVTKPSLERRAAKHLKRQGLEVYLPVFVDAYRRRRIMFPRYLFMKIVPGWQRAYRTEGVSSVLLSGLAPAQIAHKFIQKLKRSENRNGHCVIGQPVKLQEFTIGQAVRVLRGQFANMLATYQLSADGAGVGVRDVQLLGKSVRIEIPLDQLQ